MNYLLHLLVYFDIYVIVALSLNLVVGYCGALTLAHAGFYAVGAYAYAVLTVAYGWTFVPAALVGAVVAAVLSLALSLPAWRLRGDFFVLVSLAVQTLIFSLLNNWSAPGSPLGSWENLTNGPFGVTGIPRPRVIGWPVSSPLMMALFASVIAAICAVLLWRLKVSPWGRLLMAMRDDELAARGIGKDVRLAKVQAFAVCCAMVAIAGALYGAHVRYVDPTSASLDESILMLSMVIVGGVGNFRGPLVGAGVLVLLPEVLRLLALPDAVAANVRMLFYGLMLVVMMHVRPQGLAGQYRVQ